MFSDQIEIQPVTAVDQHAFLKALNAAYADYYVPIQMAPASLAELVQRESIDLDGSAAAIYQDNVIGMGLLAHREQRGWIGGMGVVPAYRRRGVGRKIMHYLLDQARDLRLTTVQLEVITQNTPAYNLYQSLGFSTLRQLHVMTRDGSISVASARSYTTPEHFVEARSAAILLEALPRIANDTAPWQREIAAMVDLHPQLRGLAAYQKSGEHVEAVCLYILRRDHIELLTLDANNSIAAEIVLVELLNRQKNAFISYLNIAEDDPVLPLLKVHGFEIHISQYEMRYILNPEN